MEVRGSLACVNVNYIATNLVIRKKYRKMRAIFEQKMKESDQLFKEEQNAVETSRRLAEEKEYVGIHLCSLPRVA